MRFVTARGTFVAVDGIDFELGPGEVLGLVGESGSGKSVTLRSIVATGAATGTCQRVRALAGAAIWSACPSGSSAPSAAATSR